MGPIEAMDNTAWQSARDLRHTIGMRLREAGVAETGRRDVLWHSAASITDHYTMAQFLELHETLEKISKPSGGWNKSLQALRAEAAAARKARAASPRN